MEIAFNIPFTCTESAENIKHLVANPSVIAQKQFTRSCEAFFRQLYPGYHVLMTTSCTKAIELMALGLDISEGDEVIMPSYGYVGVANSFANLGARLVLADIDPETMNIDSSLIEASITPRTKAVVVMHYGGVACDMAAISEVCRRKKVLLIEDNAQGIGVAYEGQMLGGYGDMSCLSFDSMKNVSCSEGGVLLYKDNLKKQVETCFENGTNKYEFLEGKVAQYEWISKGSNFAISEHNAAYLHPLLEKASDIVARRKERWHMLYQHIAADPAISALLTPGLLRYDHNGHIFFLKCRDKKERDDLLKHLNANGVASSFHYTPLHLSQRGRERGYTINRDTHTTRESDRLLRLPMYNALTDDEIGYIARTLAQYYLK